MGRVMRRIWLVGERRRREAEGLMGAEGAAIVEVV